MEKKEILKFKVFFVLSKVLLFTPVFVVFFQSKGLSFWEISLLKTITFISIVIMEIPGGLIGDRFGYKSSVIIGLILLSISCFLNTIGATFSIFFIAAIIWGIGSALISGSDIAWFYSYLKSIRQEENYSKIWGDFTFFNQLVTAICMVLSSFIFKLNENIPYIFNGIIFVVSIFMAFLIKGESVTREKKEQRLFKLKIKNIFSANLLIIFCCSILFSALIVFVFDTYQVRLSNDHFPVSLNGTLYALFVIITGLGAKTAYKIEKKNKQNVNMLIILGIVQSVSIALLAFKFGSIYTIVIFTFQEFVFGVFNVISSSLLNKMIDSNNRASFLSLLSLCVSLLKTMIYPIFGSFVDYFKIEKTYCIISLMMFLPLLLILLSNVIFRRKTKIYKVEG